MNKKQRIANIAIKSTMLLMIGIFIVISFVTYGYASTSTEGGGISEAKTVTTTTTSSTNNFSSKVSTNSDGYSGILGITEVTDTSYQEDEGSFEDITLSKIEEDTADGSASFLYTYTETGWIKEALGSSDTPTISYSDAEGYTGILYKTSFTKTGEFEEVPSDPSIGDTYIHIDYYTAYYSGIVTKNVTVWVPVWITVTQFTAEYNGTAYTEVVFQANLANPTNGQCVGEPVNIITGNYYSMDIDMSIPDLGQAMEVKRYYNSLDKKTGLLGTGWRINYDSNIVTDSTSGNETVTYPDGHAIVFKPIAGTNTYMSPETVFDELIKNLDGTYTLKLQNKCIYNYGTNKKLISITERNDNQLTIQYDTSNNIISVTGSNGNILSFTYENGKIKTVKDQTDRTITYVYDSYNNLIEVHGLGGVTKYSYNSFGLASATDENNKTYIQNEYDEFGRIIRQKDEKLNITEYSYDDVNMENTYTVQTTGKVEKYKYNAEMYITKITYSDNTYEEYTYGLYGNREAVRDRNGNTTTYTYDDRGNILTETSPAPLSYTKTYVYDDKDNIIEVSTTGGMVTTFEYDTKSNLIKSHVKLDEITQATTEYTYDLYGRLILEKDAEGNTISYGYEGNNSLPSSSTDQEGNVLNFSYDSLGRRTSITTEYGTTTFEYNQQNKIIKVIDPANNITRMKYDAVGNLIKLIKPEQYNSSTDDGTGYTYTYDAMDRLLKQIDPLGNASVAKYNQDGDKIKEINPNFYDAATDDGAGYSYVYDGSNRPIKVTNPSGQQARIFYDGVGNITKIIDANNYDESTDSGPAMQYTYDVLNRLVEIRDTSNNVTKRMVYDADGRVIKQIDAKGYNSGSNDDERYGTVYKYNLAGWMTEKRVPLKNENDTIYYNVTRYSYDKAGRLLSEKKSQQYVTLTGEPTQWNEINYTYDKTSNIKTITDSTGAYIEYSYDSLGNTVQQKAKINDTKYSITGYHYDSLGRLDKEWKEIDASDLIGDGTGVVLAETSYQYDKNGNIIKITSPEGYITNFAYDLSGRLIEKKQSVPKDQIYVIRSTASITSPRKITYPGKQYQYKVEIQPDTQINEVNLEIEYDARIMELVTATPNEAGITINTDTIGKIVISAVDKAYTTKTELAQLTFNINNQNKGTGYITICPTSNYKNGQGEVYKFTELNGKTNIVKEPDMNNDNKVETNDFTLTAIQNGINNTSPQYDEKYDIDGDGIVDVPDLDYIKDWLFAEPQQQLNKVDILRFTEKTTEAIYSKIQSYTDRIISYQYDKAGNIVQETDSNGYVTNFDYDSYNRLIRVTDKEGSKSRIFYDEVGNITKQVQPDNYDIITDNGLGTIYEYDSINRLLTVKDEQGNVIQKNIYDIYGQLVKVIDAAGYQASTTDTGRYGIEYTYDIGNRVTSIITPTAKLNSEISESYEYDAMNNVITNTDGEGNVTHYLRNQWGRITNVTDAKSVNTSYTYDYAGNLTSVTDGKNNTKNYSYNSLNLLSTITDAAGNTTTYKYDKEGRMRAETDRNGTTILYDYNIDNNLISKKTSTGSLEELYLYNKDGSLLAAINSETVDTFEYTPNLV